MRALLEHAHDAVISIDERGCVSQWNRAAERLFGWSPIETSASRWPSSSCRPRCAARWPAWWRATPAPNGLEDAHQRVTLQAIDRAGRQLSVEVSLTATRVAGRWELTAFGHDVSERRQFEARLRAMALSDGLTGLANRRGFMEALEKAVSRHARGGAPLALLFLDLDGFKRSTTTTATTWATWRCRPSRAAWKIACARATRSRAWAATSSPCWPRASPRWSRRARSPTRSSRRWSRRSRSHKLRLRASIGISLYKPPADASQFLREADHAMYHAKHNHDEVEGVSAFLTDAQFLD